MDEFKLLELRSVFEGACLGEGVLKAEVRCFRDLSLSASDVVELRDILPAVPCLKTEPKTRICYSCKLEMGRTDYVFNYQVDEKGIWQITLRCPSCNKRVKLSKQLRTFGMMLRSRVSFGKFKNKTLGEIGILQESYITWLGDTIIDPSETNFWVGELARELAALIGSDRAGYKAALKGMGL